MEITKIHDLTFHTEADIITAALSSPNELVVLMSSGDVNRYHIAEEREEHLFSIKNNLSYEDGGFDINAPSTIYTLDSIVVVVNDYKRHGFVHYPNKYKALHLWRVDYNADISRFPIALFQNADGIPHLIFGEAWNHIQIMNLDSRQILTADKSLIEQNAEERHLEFYKNYSEDNKLPWPRPYDYFFGELKMSPSKKNFLSAGWVWGSFDAYNIYEVEDFINNNRINEMNIAGWEHCNRAVCWIDEETVAITYNPWEEGDEGATKDAPHEMHFYKVNMEGSEIERKFQIVGVDTTNAKIHFHKGFNYIVLFSDRVGTVLLSLAGEVIFHDQNMNQDAYFSDLNLFLKTDGKSVAIHQIKKG